MVYRAPLHIMQRGRLDWMDDGFESFNGKSTSASDNDVLSSPDGKFSTRSVGTEENLFKRITASEKQSYLRYRQKGGYNAKKSLKKFDTRVCSKSHEHLDKAHYGSWIDENHSSSEDIETNSDNDVIKCKITKKYSVGIFYYLYI